MKGGHFALLSFTALTSLISTSCSNITERLQATIAEQAQKLTYLEAIVLQQSGKLTRADALLEQLSASVDNLHSKNHDTTGRVVAFEAQYSDDPHHNILDSEVMVFDQVNTNFGNGYDVRNGTFKAPLSGVYVFQMKVTPSPKGHVYVYLMANGQRFDSADASDDTNVQTGHSLKIVQLTEGDSVWMSKSNGVTSVRGWAHTKLSGFLLRERA